MRLTSELGAKAQEDNLPFAVGHGDSCGFADKTLFSAHPAGEEDVARVVRI